MRASTGTWDGGRTIPVHRFGLNDEENVDIVYQPALRLLPSKMVFGHSFKGECQMIVTNLKDGSPRDKGWRARRLPRWRMRHNV